MAEKTEALTAILEDIQDQAGLVTDQIHAEVQQLQDEEIHFFTESLHKETGHYEEKEISRHGGGYPLFRGRPAGKERPGGEA